VLFSISVNASLFSLNSEDLKQINKRYDAKKVFNRIVDYETFLSDLKNAPVNKKLVKVNYKVNKIISMYDKQSKGVGDYWSTPKEFLIEGEGDCEDYAITKYFSLKELGVKESKLFLAICRVNHSRTLHMVLLYFKNRVAIPLVLDNLSWRILPLNKRQDLKIKFIFNEHQSFLMKNSTIEKKVKINWGSNKNWENLLKRVYHEKSSPKIN